VICGLLYDTFMAHLCSFRSLKAKKSPSTEEKGQVYNDMRARNYDKLLN